VGRQLLAGSELRQGHAFEARESLLILRVCLEKPV
jgi:hypothetical protein